jgi:hypothetical protein
MNEQLNLPRKYKDEKHPDRIGLPYISYSQHTSFNEIGEFHYQMILNYIFGIKVESRFQAYADMGSASGEYVEDKSKKENPLLNEKDKTILNKYIDSLPDDCEYEREIWIKRDGYHIYGFEDVFYPEKKKGEGVEVVDVKTGSIVKKGPFYASESYGQTNLYAYYEDVIKGNKIKDCRVVMFDREGNAMKENPDELHLTGQVKDIPTPYSRVRAEKVIKKMDNTAKALSSLKTTYDKLSTLTMEF